MMGFVYLWRNIKTNKKYIGSHKGSPDDGYVGSGLLFSRAYKKNPDDFTRQILYIGENYRKIEARVLRLLNAAKSKDFYNLKNDAIGGWEHAHTKEANAKRRGTLSNLKKGIYPEHLKYDKSGSSNPMFGKKHTDEAKLKISLKRLGVANKKQPVVELVSGRTFETVNACAEFYGVTASTISTLMKKDKLVKRGKTKNTHFRAIS
jgi:hypothetical protein